VHVQAGDYYGRPVNLASRLTGIAKPGSVLLDEAAKAAAGEGFQFSYAGEKRLKGFDHRAKLFRARRVDEGDGDESAERPGASRRRRAPG
jgi:adenylate cyclase